MKKRQELFKKIGIVGLGLMGGSIALAAKKYKISQECLGVAHSKETFKKAQKYKIVDKVSRDFKILKDADLVILATPVETIKEIALLISKIIKKECIVTDVGSVKKEIVLKLEKILPNYVGSHPLAGSHHTGMDYADAKIFKDSLCIITPTAKTLSNSLSKIKKFWEVLGMHVVSMPAPLHDRILAYTSHLPHLIAFNMVYSLPCGYLKYSAPSFKEMTRVALSSPRLWQDIFINNRKEIIMSLKMFTANLSILEKILIKKDIAKLGLFLKKSQEKRMKLL